MSEQTYGRELFLFTKPGQLAKLVLPDGFRFMFFVHGDQPEVAPIDEPGCYEIDIPAMLAKGRYPVAVTTVDLANVAAIKRLPASAVNDMLAAALRARAALSTTPDLSRDEGRAL